MSRFWGCLKKWRIGIFLAVLAAIFCVGTASYNYLTQSPDFVKWGSPDETANYVFSKLYAETGRLEIFERYNLYAADLIHPRSVRSDFGELKPVSFLGIILVYGKIGALFGTAVLPYLTPILAALGLIFFYLLVKEIFGKNNALISTALLAVFTVYIYYTARSFFHNVPFVVFLLAGLYFIILILKNGAPADSRQFSFWRDKFIFPALGGIFIGLALMMRSSEILWVAPVLFIIWIFNVRRLGWTKLIIFVCFVWLALLPMFYYNQILYGSFFSGGYSEINRSLQTIGHALSANLSAPQTIKVFAHTVFYFGFHPRQSLTVFRHYFIDMFPWLFWPAAAGLIIFFARLQKWSKKHIIYLLSWLALSAILVLYYGSWKFTDNPDPRRFTIGNSYTRYWLPMYLGALPFVSLFIQKITRLICRGHRLWRNGLRIVLVTALAAVSLNFVLFGSEEGLVFNWYTAKSNHAIFDEVLAVTEKNSVIITQYHDKVFFPERKVIIGLLDDPAMNIYYAQLAARLPVYYFNFKINNDALAYLNNGKFAALKIRIKLVELADKDFGLYKIEPVPATTTPVVINK